jgi:hypothetical protein
MILSERYIPAAIWATPGPGKGMSKVKLDAMWRVVRDARYCTRPDIDSIFVYFGDDDEGAPGNAHGLHHVA